jgi:hypothetical protein
MSKEKIWIALTFLLVNVIFVSSLTKANVPPVLGSIGAKTVHEFHTLIFGVHATDADGDPIVLETANMPANSTFYDSGNGSGYFRFTPGYTQAGTYYVTFIARDTVGAADSEVVQITVIDQSYSTIFVSDTITYQGRTKTEVSVYIDNPDQYIEGFTLDFTIVPNDRAYFTTDHFEVSIDTICSGVGRPCHPDSIIRIDTTISRVVKIDKNGSLTNNFSILESHGDVGDTTSPYCINMGVLGLAPNGQPLGPGFGLLFKLYLDVLCLSDTLLPDTLVFVNVGGTLAQGDTLIKAKLFLPGRPFIFGGVKYGDANNDNNISVSDVVYLISYLFKGGPPPNPQIEGDANGDGQVSVADVVYVINYLFKGGPPPHCHEIEM